MHKCCDVWEQAQQPGTDNEMYGSLLYCWKDSGMAGRGGAVRWALGCDLPEPKFCPWCGAKVITMPDSGTGGDK